MGKCWKINNKSGNFVELLFYGDVVSDSWDEDDVTPTNLIDDLNSLNDVDTLRVRINSYGGNVFAGNAIKSTLERYASDNDVNIDVYVDGIAASIASVIAMAGDTIYMPSNSLMMIHNPWMLAEGNAQEFRKIADDLDTMRETLINAYQDKTDLDRQTIIDYMDEETWFTANEAVNLGFADKIESREVAAAYRPDNKLVMNEVKFDANKLPKDLIENAKNVVKDKDNQGGEEDMPYKEFETEEDFNKFKNNIIEDAREGYVEVENVLDNFSEIGLSDVEDVENLVEEVKEVKDEYEQLQNDIQNAKELSKKKDKLANADIELEDLDIENEKELLEVSDKVLDMMIKAVNNAVDKVKDKQVKDKKDKDNDVDVNNFANTGQFDPNAKLTTDDVDNLDVIKAL